MIKIGRPNLEFVKRYLEDRRKQIEQRIASLTKEDPFSDTARLSDNAASDTEAKEEIGHERIEALQKELAISLARVKQALAKIGIGKYGICDNCGRPIGLERLKAFPMAQYCLSCEKEMEKKK